MRATIHEASLSLLRGEVSDNSAALLLRKLGAKHLYPDHRISANRKKQRHSTVLFLQKKIVKLPKLPHIRLVGVTVGVTRFSNFGKVFNGQMVRVVWRFLFPHQSFDSARQCTDQADHC